MGRTEGLPGGALPSKEVRYPRGLVVPQVERGNDLLIEGKDATACSLPPLISPPPTVMPRVTRRNRELNASILVVVGYVHTVSHIKINRLSSSSQPFHHLSSTHFPSDGSLCLIQAPSFIPDQVFDPCSFRASSKYTYRPPGQVHSGRFRSHSPSFESVCKRPTVPGKKLGHCPCCQRR